MTRRPTRTWRTFALAAGLGLGGLTLALWRADIPFARLRDRYGRPSSRVLALPDGVRLHYRDVGRADGPVLVLLHGYSASSLDWQEWVERLGDRYRLILVDLPGHGLTEAPAGYEASIARMVACIAALLDALACPAVVLVGNSMGGQVVWRYAVDRPTRVAGLVLIGSTGWTDERQATSQGLFRFLGHAAGRFLLRHLDLTWIARRGLRSVFADPSRVTPSMVTRYTDLARAPGHRDILTGLQMQGGDATQLARLGTLDMPTLILAGDQDQLVPVADGHRFARAIRNSTLIVYPAVGHVPMQEIPDRTADDLHRWIESHVAKGASSGLPT